MSREDIERARFERYNALRLAHVHHYEALRMINHEHPLPAIPRSGFSTAAQRKAWVKRQILEGHTRTAIAESLGLSIQRVSQIAAA